MGNVPSGCDGYSTCAVLLNTFLDTFLSIVPLVPLVQLLTCILYIQAIHMYMYIGVHVHRCNCANTLQIFIHLHLYTYIDMYYSSTIHVMNTCMQEWPAGLTGHPHILLEVQLHSFPDWEPPQSSRLLGATYI